jgi:hypothetical protein
MGTIRGIAATLVGIFILNTGVIFVAPATGVAELQFINSQVRFAAKLHHQPAPRLVLPKTK